MLDGVEAPGWAAEARCLIISAQSMTTLGYTKARPGSALTDLIACCQALLGIFFVAIFAARWVAVRA